MHHDNKTRERGNIVIVKYTHNHVISPLAIYGHIHFIKHTNSAVRRIITFTIEIRFWNIRL